jgi:hypothetical protein
MFENSVLREIFGPKRVEVTGGGKNYITWHVASVGKRYI